MMNMIVMLIQSTGIKFSKMQKALLTVLMVEFVIVGIVSFGRMVGQQFLWYTVQPWMVVSEAACSLLVLPLVITAIWKS